MESTCLMGITGNYFVEQTRQQQLITSRKSSCFVRASRTLSHILYLIFEVTQNKEKIDPNIIILIKFTLWMWNLNEYNIIEPEKDLMGNWIFHKHDRLHIFQKKMQF